MTTVDQERESRVGAPARPSAVRRRVVVPIVAVLALVLGGLLVEAAAGAVPSQDIASSGPLTHVFVGNDLSCQVAHAGDTVYELYPPGAAPADCGTLVFAAGTLYAPDFANHDGTATGGLGATTPYTPVSQTPVTGAGTRASPFTVVTVVDLGTTGLRITQTDSYVIGDEFYRTDVTLANTTAADVPALIYRGGDCFLQGSDSGFGFTSPAEGAAGCSANANNTPPSRIEEWLPITGGNTFLEDGFSTVWAAIGAHGPLANTCQCDAAIDNGAAIAWAVTVPAGGQVTRSQVTAFSPTGVIPTPPPDVSGVSPASGPQAGGTTVTITGTNLTGATGVAFGSAPAASFTLDSPTQITAVAPPGTGTVDVVVTTPNGTSAVGAPDRYTYTPPPPAVSGLSPSSGPEAGGTTVTITGTNFTGATGVAFGSAPAASFTLDSPTQITAVAPPGTGTVDVVVTTPSGLSAAGPPDAFAYTTAGPPPPGSPVVSSLAPASGPTTGGGGVVVFGSDLGGATAVHFGAVAGTVLGVNAAGTQLTALAPPGSGTVAVTVTTPRGTSPPTGASTYSYVPPTTGTSTATPGGTTGATTGATTGGTATGDTTGGTTTAGTTTGTPGSVTQPVLHTSAPKVISSSSAEFTATINPEGLPTTMHFDYTAELPGGASAAAVTYDAHTPEQPVGSDFADHTVTATVASLLPNSTYHVRAVAANSAGVAPSPDATFKTAADPPPPPPVLGKEVNAQPVSGTVFVLLPGAGHVAQAHASLAKGVGFIPLTEARQLPVGTIFDASAGVARLTSATVVKGKPQTGDFGGGVFKVLQNRRERGLTELDLVVSAATARTCPTVGKAARAAARKALPKAVLNLLRGSDSKGKFRTKGRFSSATVRGTVWTTSDRCDGTLTTVKRGSVVV
ncbi:MAG: hypothetical protein QOE44_1270, partial [Solirubrobacteraceae bacterium]|nr:hypothetical protein [Solirubrobacteraceae bacterium]